MPNERNPFHSSGWQFCNFLSFLPAFAPRAVYCDLQAIKISTQLSVECREPFVRKDLTKDLCEEGDICVSEETQ